MNASKVFYTILTDNNDYADDNDNDYDYDVVDSDDNKH